MSDDPRSAADDGGSSSGSDLHGFVSDLFPICRSITGDGVRETLRLIGERVPLEVREVPSGTQVLDWTVPDEWNIRDAWVRNPAGEKVIDFKRSNLHVVSYSVPVRGTFTLDELRPRLHTLPDHARWIPYRTSYYAPDWGFCLAHEELDALSDGEYEVVIDSTLAPGHLTYGEVVLPGRSEREVLISAHVCHPSLANDNLSAIAVATEAARVVQGWDRRYTYRFLFAPGTIGAITWLARNEDAVNRIAHGLVLSCLGDSGSSTYKRSRRGTAEIDRAVEHVLEHSGAEFRVRDFVPWGYDERQYCSPGYDLPVGALMRTPNGEFPEYHTSADDLELVQPRALANSLETLLDTFRVLESNIGYRSRSPRGEPRLGKRGLSDGGDDPEALRAREALLWVLNLADGAHSLLDVATRSGLPFPLVRDAVRRLDDAELLTSAEADAAEDEP